MLAKTGQCNLSLALEAQPSLDPHARKLPWFPMMLKADQSINRWCQSCHFHLLTCLTNGSCPYRELFHVKTLFKLVMGYPYQKQVTSETDSLVKTSTEAPTPRLNVWHTTLFEYLCDNSKEFLLTRETCTWN